MPESLDCESDHELAVSPKDVADAGLDLEEMYPKARQQTPLECLRRTLSNFFGDQLHNGEMRVECSRPESCSGPGILLL